MTRKLLVLVLFMSLCVYGFSLDVSGDVSGTWLLAESPINVIGEINVPLNQSLTIEPGVQVVFGGHYKFIINGQLLANGTAVAPIVFTATNAVDGWHGLRFINTDTTIQPASSLSYALLQYGRATGVSPDYRGGGIYCDSSSNLTLTNVEISDCSAVGNGGAIYLDDSDITLDEVLIENNTAAGGAGISMNSSNPEISNTIIRFNEATYDGGGVYCNLSNPDFYRVEISSNTTSWNGGGICLFNNSSVDLANVTLINNLATQDGSAIASMYNSAVTLLNSIVWSNAYNGIYKQPNSSIAATYSDLQGGTGQSYFGEGCIDANPLMNAAYQLTWANAPTPDSTMSPCIDTGDPDGALDPDGTRADMGAYYFVQAGITGVVTLTGGTGNVEDVVITANDGTTTTTTNPDAAGNYLLNVGNGTYAITAQLNGYNSANFTNIIVDDEVVILNISLSPPLPGIIQGKVELEGNGDPTQVQVAAGNITTNPYPVEDPTQPGVIAYYEYQLELSPGTYDVTASLNGYNPQTLNGITVNSNLTNEDNDFYLTIVQEEGTITGTVSLIGGSGNIQEVTITADAISVHPDATGYYELTILNGNYTVTASLNGYSTAILDDIPVIAFQTVEDVDFLLIDGWQPITGTQYITTLYATTDYDGDFVTGEGMNQLGVFDGTGDCRGNAIWIEGNHPLWHNYWPLDGYWYISIVGDNNSGTELLSFRFFNEADSSITACNEGFFFPTDPNTDNSINLTVPSPDHTQSFDFIQNWNWISFNLHPANAATETIFAPLATATTVGNLQVKNQDKSHTYYSASGVWVGNLNFITDGDGFKVNIPAAYNDFDFTGTKINPVTNTISLGYQYNWLGYYPYTSMTLEDAFEGLHNPVTAAAVSPADSMVVKTQTKSATYYGGWIGDLTIMEPGKMYMVYMPIAMTGSDTTFVNLAYPPATTTRAAVEQVVYNPAGWQLLEGTKANMVVMAAIDTDAADYCVGVFDAAGNCRSIGKAYDGFSYFTIVGNEAGEELFFHLYNEETGETLVSDASIEFVENGATGTPRSPMQIRFDGANPSVPGSFNLSQNYPNPFNPVTAISYTIPADGHVTLQVFNTRGQLVDTLIDGHQKADNYSITWNAEKQSSGIYFYKMQYDGKSEIKKCILLK
jgi:hypothetical protein